jgi:hypothetical protein
MTLSESTKVKVIIEASSGQDDCDEYEDFCDLCAANTPSVIACQDCLLRLCEAHQTAHTISRLTIDHILVPTDTLDLDSIITIEENRRFVRFGKNCKTHNQFILNKFCKECFVLVCAECSFSAIHDGHRIQLFQDVRRSLKESFELEKLSVVANKIKELIEIKDDITKWEQEMELTHKDATELLTTEYTDRKEDMESQFKKGMTFLDNIYNDTKDLLKTKRILIETRLEETNEVAEGYKRVANCPDPYEFPTKIKSYIDVIDQLHSNRTDIITSVSFDQPQNLYDLITPKGKTEKVQYFTEYSHFVDGIYPFMKFEIIGSSIRVKNPIIDAGGLEHRLDVTKMVFDPVLNLCHSSHYQYQSLISVTESEDKKSFLLGMSTCGYCGGALSLVDTPTELKYKLGAVSYSLATPFSWKH